jgi:hypothetical protein
MSFRDDDGYGQAPQGSTRDQETESDSDTEAKGPAAPAPAGDDARVHDFETERKDAPNLDVCVNVLIRVLNYVRGLDHWRSSTRCSVSPGHYQTKTFLVIGHTASGTGYQIDYRVRRDTRGVLGPRGQKILFNLENPVQRWIEVLRRE